MGISKRIVFGVVAALISAGVIAALVARYASQPWPAKPLETAFYVWQMQWNEGVREAVAHAAPSSAQFMVLLGEVNVAAATPTFAAAQVDWKALAATNVKTTLVLRAGAGLNKQLASDAFATVRAYISRLLSEAVAAARANGATVSGIQLDYDSPTSGLTNYKRLLDALRADIPKEQWSITTLPTWLKDGDFPALVVGLSYYVLQVHSLDPPTTLDKPMVLFDSAKTAGYLRRAASLKVPFYLALPTYGYQVAFDEKGKFVALSAEGPSRSWKPGIQVKTTMADPARIAGTVRSITQSTPPCCQGIVWFRLPVESDDLNWSWPTLEAVRQGRAPQQRYAAEIKTLSPGLYEVWVANTGETSGDGSLRCEILWQDARPAAFDLVNTYRAAQGSSATGVTISGPAPRQGKSIMVGWFRFNQTTPSSTPPLRTGKVEIVR